MEQFISNYDFDYVIGSVHWVGDFGIDLAEYRKEWDRRDLYECTDNITIRWSRSRSPIFLTSLAI